MITLALQFSAEWIYLEFLVLNVLKGFISDQQIKQARVSSGPGESLTGSMTNEELSSPVGPGQLTAVPVGGRGAFQAVELNCHLLQGQTLQLPLSGDQVRLQSTG